MLDQSEKGSASEDQNKKYPEWIQPKGTQNQNIRIETMKNCADCGTSKTPLWRGGPAGPKSLCNACGIRSRKKRRAILGLNKGEDKKSKRGNNNSNGNNNNNNNKRSSSSNTPKNLGDNLKQRLLSLGRQVLMQRSTVEENQRRKLGEEEQAALLLMALSYGSVYA